MCDSSYLKVAHRRP